jgi:hypothetical protein
MRYPHLFYRYAPVMNFELKPQDLRNLPCEPLQVGARHALPLRLGCTKVENA